MKNKLKILGKIGIFTNAKYKKTMPFLPGLHLRTLRQNSRSAHQKLAEKIALLKQKSFKQIGEVFERFIPRTLLKRERDGALRSWEPHLNQTKISRIKRFRMISDLYDAMSNTHQTTPREKRTSMPSVTTKKLRFNELAET